MTDIPAPAWRPTGLAWTQTGATLEWLSPTGEVRASAVDLDARLTLRIGADRRCVGRWWGGRRVPCAARTPIEAGAKSGRAHCPP